MDCHVFVKPRAIGRLIKWFDENPARKAILSGPMHYDNREMFSTHFADQWRGTMWGTWASAWMCKACDHHFSIEQVDGMAIPITLEMNHRSISKCNCGRSFPATAVEWPQHEQHFMAAGFRPAAESDEDPEFEIPGMGLGLFACRKSDWPGFVEGAAGFGAEELCIHEAMRQDGGVALCLPWLRWLHRFARPDGVPYTLLNASKVRNYCLWFQRLGRDFEPIRKHMIEESGLMSPQDWERCAADPMGFTDGIPGRKVESCSTCGGDRTSGGQSRPQPPEDATFDEGFEWCKNTPRDLNEHLDTIAKYAGKVDRVTAITKRRETVIGLMAGKPKNIHVYDTEQDELYERVHEWAAAEDVIEKLSVTAIQDFNLARIEPTDLLFIDTIHSAEQLSSELQRFAPNVSRFLIIRGTGNFAEISEDRRQPGLLVALRDFMKANPEWSVIEHRMNQYGMTVLSRAAEDKPKLPSKLKIAANFAGALASHVATGAEHATPETMEYRLKICSMCPHRSDSACSVCGCPVDKKASWAEQSCPIGLWPKSDPWADTESLEVAPA
jgi:hypothetical protein